MVGLSTEEYSRYARHLILPEVGEAGQLKLRESSVLLVGLGGLGSPIAMYLAAAGIGKLGLVDADQVDLSNLQRQIIHTTDWQHQAKVDSAAAAIKSLNQNVAIETYYERFNALNGLEISRDFDLIIDGTDNFSTRYLVNDACVLLGKPNCYGAVLRFQGQASVFNFDGGPCYRCLFPEPPPADLAPSCAEAGVLGVLPGLIGTIQATEAIKVLLNAGTTLSGRLLVVDAMNMEFRKLNIERNPKCKVCGQHRTIHELEEIETRACEVQPVDGTELPEWTVERFQQLRMSGESHFLLDVREAFEQEICTLGGTLIPLSELEGKLDSVPKNVPLIVHCKSGGRSAKAVDVLRRNGFDNAINLKGGILAWATQIEPAMSKY